MYSNALLENIKEHCVYFCKGNDDTGDNCTQSSECLYKAECDNIRHTYNCKPCDLVIREVQ